MNTTRLGALGFLPVLLTQPHVAGAAWAPYTLTDSWHIRQVDPVAALDRDMLDEAGRPTGTDWLPVSDMPSMVHDVLVEHGVIETPWLPGRAEACKWVAEKDWIYATRFTAEQPGGDAWLRFKGLDTIADVYLNGEQIASHANMYVPLRVNVTDLLLSENTLVLHFHSVFETVDGKKKPIRRLPGPPARRVARPGNNYNDYLGPEPHFSRVGVFDEVVLEFTGGCEMTEVVAGTSLNASLEDGVVEVDVVGVSRVAEAALDVRVLHPEGEVAGAWSGPLTVREGRFEEHVRIPVDEPRLWWPRGYGDQPLYRAEVTLRVEGRPHQIIRRTLGFRRITMPKRLHFEVNGVPVMLRGGCWVTPRWDTAVWDPERVEQLLRMAAHAHFNAFRVWGVVESPRDDFYERADRDGYLIWQDFTNLPLGSGDGSRRESVAEAEMLLKRLKHHPSILCWCGGNEAAMWHDQEFNAQLEDRGPWPGRVAASDVEQRCQQLDPERYYQPSSPYFGQDPNDPREGNTHGYTSMWFVPGYDYLNFASEDTRIGPPPLHSLHRFMAPEDIWPAAYSPVYAAGSRYPFPEVWLDYTTSSSWKKTGPVEQFYDPVDAESLVYRLAMAPARYYQETIERQRRGRPATSASHERRCGGYIVWKYNDSWPQVYSGKVDYFLEPTITYYALRRAFAPVMLSFDVGAHIYLWVVNDSREEVEGTVRVRLLHLDRNEVRREVSQAVTVPPGQSQVALRLDEAGIGSFRLEHVLGAELVDARGAVLSTSTTLCDIERRIQFPEARLKVDVHDGTLEISSDQFARAVHLTGDADGDAFGWSFEDNYFDLMPGETKRVQVLGRHSAGRITARPYYSPVATAVDWKR